MNIALLKHIDRIIGSPLARMLPAPAVGDIQRVKPLAILFIRPGGIGDAVHLIPAINVLKVSYPDVAIDILAEKRNGDIFRLCPHVRRLFHYDRPLDLLKSLRGNYDVVIDSEQWHRLSAVVARFVRAPLKIGFGTNERSRLFNCPVSYSHDDYEVKCFLRLLEPLGISAQLHSAGPWLTVPEYAGTKADELLNGEGNGRFVAIFPGASIPERRWGADRFRMVVQVLAHEGIPAVVVGGGQDAADGDEIMRGLPGINLAARTSLTETAAVLKRCSVLLSGDSGILHIGVGLGIPTVSLFGPGIARKWAPRGDNHLVINRELPCSPCTKFGYTPQCQNGAHCISEIQPEEVVAAIISLLHRKTP